MQQELHFLLSVFARLRKHHLSTDRPTFLPYLGNHTANSSDHWEAKGGAQPGSTPGSTPGQKAETVRVAGMADHPTLCLTQKRG